MSFMYKVSLFCHIDTQDIVPLNRERERITINEYQKISAEFASNTTNR